MNVVAQPRGVPPPPPPSTSNGAASSDQLLQSILANPRLPSPPALALQVVEAVSRPNCNVQEIANLLAHDAALCGKLLKIANSILVSPTKRVTSVQHAIAILGFNRLRSLVLSLSLPAMQSRMVIDEGLKRFWKNSVAGAIMARELAATLGYENPEEELVVGVLRDLGMMLLQQSFPDAYHPVWSGAVELWAERQLAWETAHLGIHHAEVSAGLLYSWRLPSEIVEPIRFHHQPSLLTTENAPLYRRAVLMEFTSRLAQLEDVRIEPEFMQGILDTAREEFALDPAQLEAFLASVRPMIEDFAAAMQVDIGDCPHFDAVLAAGCEELVRLSMEGNRKDPTSDSHPTAHAARHLATTYHCGDDLLAVVDSDDGSADVGDFTDASLEFLDRLEKSYQQVHIGSYQIVQLIGRGAMGVVYKARDIHLNRFVALKAMTRERASNKRARRRFALEARAAANIRHENVVTIFAVSDVYGVPFMVMEYIAGISLQDWLDYGRVFSGSEIARIGSQIAAGLSAAHALRLVHRDIKPANILLEDGSEHVRISDFGLARILDNDAQLSQDGTLIGTPLFMSPEQATGKPVDAMADMFSLGSLLYTLCTGKPPFDGESLYAILHAVAEREPQPIPARNPAISSRLVKLIATLHAKDASKRLSAKELAQELAYCA